MSDGWTFSCFGVQIIVWLVRWFVHLPGDSCSLPFPSREHDGTERDTEGVVQNMSMPLKLLLVSGSLFSETSAQITTSI